MARSGSAERFSWLLALQPAVLIVELHHFSTGPVLAATVSAWLVGGAVMLVLGTCLGFCDTRALKQAGVRLSPAWVVVPAAYFILRTLRNSGRGVLQLVLHTVLTIAALAMTAVAVTPTVLKTAKWSDHDDSWMAEQVTAQLREKGRLPAGTRVDCSAPPDIGGKAYCGIVPDVPGDEPPWVAVVPVYRNEKRTATADVDGLQPVGPR
ncbi:hypothetical protein AB0368_14630 [Actinoplanes sp. NPDC051475]|uniref:hypothetical protein n=1 Tax=Actinoplanes sp. NPDC051475 TaxID=3157225 RepID=UPI00344E834F